MVSFTAVKMSKCFLCIAFKMHWNAKTWAQMGRIRHTTAKTGRTLRLFHYANNPTSYCKSGLGPGHNVSEYFTWMSSTCTWLAYHKLKNLLGPSTAANIIIFAEPIKNFPTLPSPTIRQLKSSFTRIKFEWTMDQWTIVCTCAKRRQC